MVTENNKFGTNNNGVTDERLNDIALLADDISHSDIKDFLFFGASSSVFQNLAENAISTALTKLQPFANPEVNPLPEYRELPDEYGDTKIVLLVRDPEWVFVYWEINDTSRQEHTLPKDHDSYQLLVRIYQISDRNWPTEKAHYYYDIQVACDARSAYICIPEADKTWIVELGYMDKANNFQMICRSEKVSAPPNRLSEDREVKWLIIGENKAADPTVKTFTKQFRIGERTADTLDELLGGSIAGLLYGTIDIQSGSSADSAGFHGGLSSAEHYSSNNIVR